MNKFLNLIPLLFFTTTVLAEEPLVTYNPKTGNYYAHSIHPDIAIRKVKTLQQSVAFYYVLDADKNKYAEMVIRYAVKGTTYDCTDYSLIVNGHNFQLPNKPKIDRKIDNGFVLTIVEYKIRSEEIYSLSSMNTQKLEIKSCGKISELDELEKQGLVNLSNFIENIKIQKDSNNV